MDSIRKQPELIRQSNTSRNNVDSNTANINVDFSTPKKDGHVNIFFSQPVELVGSGSSSKSQQFVMTTDNPLVSEVATNTQRARVTVDFDPNIPLEVRGVIEPRNNVIKQGLSVQKCDNLMKPTGTQNKLNQDLLNYYNFWKNKYVKTYLDGSYVFYNAEGYSSPQNAVTVSEAHGYLMISSVMMADKVLFDRAVNYLVRFRNGNNLLGWQQVQNGSEIAPSPNGTTSATDGDLDILYSLYLAYYQWKEERYLTLAKSYSQGFRSKCINNTYKTLKLGDWVWSDTDNYGKLTRPCDFMLMHLHAFSLVEPENAKLWGDLYENIIKICDGVFKTSGRNTGLISDFLQYNGSAWVAPAGQVLEANTDKDYSWNSSRIFMRLPTAFMRLDRYDMSLYQMIFKANEFIKTATGNNPSRIMAGYTLAGAPINTYSSLTFTSPFMMAAAVSQDQTWLNSIYNHILSLNVNSGSYFGDSIHLMTMIQVTGNFLTIR